MFKYNKKIILTWVAVLFWMFIIFTLSAQSAKQSNGLSKNVTEAIIESTDRTVPQVIKSSTTANLVSRANNIVRKSAHFFAYLVLGILVINAVRRSETYMAKVYRISLFICILYAMSDELHQMFVPGRGPAVKDVLIDAAGAIVGIGVYLLINRKKTIKV